MGAGFDYASEFQKLDSTPSSPDLRALMTDSQDWWPMTGDTTAVS